MKRIELPTLGVAFLVHFSWLWLTFHAAELPWWLVVPVGGFVIAWHGSLQHETIHGHPTASRRLNALVGSLPVGLWLPYGVYRDAHVAHHKTGELTDPLDDPESFYLTRDAWARAGGVLRALAWANNTLVGRLVIGPPRLVARFLREEVARLLRGDRRHVAAWAAHLVGVAAIVAWLELVCRMSVARYAVEMVYPGVALTLLRSFIEHRPGRTNVERIGIVEAGPIASLLFLNNNLHVVHHLEPGLPWYEIPAHYRARRAELVRDNGGFVFSGYGALLARFGLRPKDAPAHPTR